MRTLLEIEKIDLKGRKPPQLVLRRPMRSWTLGFIQLLYMLLAQQGAYYGKTNVRGYQSLSYALANSNPVGCICAGAGESAYRIYDDTINPGKMLGIQLGAGTDAEDAGNMSLSKRFTQGAWELNRSVFPPDMTKTWQDVCSDGTNLYALNTTDNKVHKLDIYTGAEVTSYACAFVNTNCICYDSTNDKLWAGQVGGANLIYDMNKNTGASTVNFGVGNIYAICWDAVNQYICARQANNTVYRYDGAGNPQANVVDPAGAWYYGLGFDGTNLFSSPSQLQVCEFSLAGAEQDRWPNQGYMDGDDYGLHYDGGDFWVCSQSAKIFRRFQKEPSGMQITGTEIVDFTIAGADATFVLRCFATNHSGGALTIEEIGIQGHPWGMLFARDVLGGGAVALADTEMAKITYTMKITV
jgi:hypothetical protein